MDLKRIDEVLEEREGTHGEFAKMARAAQGLILTSEFTQSYERYSDELETARLMICMKLARISQGDATNPDHWRDIAGYALLAERVLTKGKTPA